jgi:hypothetical protein
MAPPKLNLDITKSVAEFESAAKKINLNLSKKRADSFKEKEKSLPNKKFERKKSLEEWELMLKKWKKIFNLFLIFSVCIIIALILILSHYYRIESQQRKIIQNENEDYMTDYIHFTPKLNNSFFYLPNFTGISEKNIQSFVVIGDEKCKPNIICRYVGYTREYDLSTLLEEDFLLDKKVINCFDRSNCMSNFTYLESSEELFSRQRIRIEKSGENKVEIYDERDNFVAEIEKRDLGYIEELYIWFKF